MSIGKVRKIKDGRTSCLWVVSPPYGGGWQPQGVAQRSLGDGPGIWRNPGNSPIRHPQKTAWAEAHPVIQQFYQRLLKKGKTKMTALIAAMRKLLTILNTMLMKHGTQEVLDSQDSRYLLTHLSRCLTEAKHYQPSFSSHQSYNTIICSSS